MSGFGHQDGDRCGRNYCNGIIGICHSENCSCHISPPCSSCTSPRAFCPKCDWREKDDIVVNDFVVTIDKVTGVYKSYERRPLDKTRIDWHSKPHTNSSMIKEGVCPDTATMEDVRTLVNGTFGGRFEQFGNGTFKFIAYTD